MSPLKVIVRPFREIKMHTRWEYEYKTSVETSHLILGLVQKRLWRDLGLICTHFQNVPNSTTILIALHEITITG